MFYGYQIFTRRGYYMAEMCLILALDSNIGPRANVAIQWHYELVAHLGHIITVLLHIYCPCI